MPRAQASMSPTRRNCSSTSWHTTRRRPPIWERREPTSQAVGRRIADPQDVEQALGTASIQPLEGAFLLSVDFVFARIDIQHDEFAAVLGLHLRAQPLIVERLSPPCDFLNGVT